MARRVDKVQRPLAVGPVVEQAHGLRLDGDAPFALELHGVQDLVHPVSFGDGIRDVQEPVGQGALAVVYVRDYAEIARAIDAIHP